MMPESESLLSGTAIAVANAPERGSQFGKWDVYPLLWQETSKISDRRQTANTLYLSVNSLLLGGIAFLAQQSQLQSVSLLVVEIVVAIAGLIIAGRWYKLLEKYRQLLKLRYQILENIEKMPDFPGAATTFVEESNHPETWGFSTIEELIPRTFQWLYVLGTVLLIAGTIAVKIGVGAWLAHHITLPTIQ